MLLHRKIFSRYKYIFRRDHKSIEIVDHPLTVLINLDIQWDHIQRLLYA